jgi:hypothetical protein
MLPEGHPPCHREAALAWATNVALSSAHGAVGSLRWTFVAVCWGSVVRKVRHVMLQKGGGVPCLVTKWISHLFGSEDGIGAARVGRVELGRRKRNFSL